MKKFKNANGTETTYNFRNEELNRNREDLIGSELIFLSGFREFVKLYEKSFDIREVKQLKDIIVDINELSDKRLIVITRVKL